MLVKIEGIILVIEFVYVLVKVFELVKSMMKEEIILICLLGWGDKDVYILVNLLEGKEEEYEYVWSEII